MLRVGVKINYFPQVNWFPTIIDRDCVFLRTALSFIINTYFDNFVSINDWEEPIFLNPNTQKILLKTSKKKHPVVSQRGLDCIESSGSSDTFKCYIPVALNCNWVVNSDSIQVWHLVVAIPLRLEGQVYYVARSTWSTDNWYQDCRRRHIRLYDKADPHFHCWRQHFSVPHCNCPLGLGPPGWKLALAHPTGCNLSLSGLDFCHTGQVD